MKKIFLKSKQSKISFQLQHQTGLYYGIPFLLELTPSSETVIRIEKDFGVGGGDTFISPLNLDCFVDKETLALSLLGGFKMDHKVYKEFSE